jgi:hypothetical protein
MTTLRKVALSALLTVSAFSAVTFTSCNKSDSACATGYTGSKCDSTFSDKYVAANYNVSETKDGVAFPPTFTCSVTKASTNPATTVTITNFGNSGVAINATVDNIGNITIPTGTAIGTHTITGSGVLTSNNITFTYTLSGGTSIYVDAMTRL